ncbi:lipoate--protein ligase [Secundilactobacillus odoratitofui DSM 19909 = JCM 15043]|uniref:lipoate--protein ligase n=1 Tax=Secundilactobacillus odoratitofui DSM 19909 = JCM 15043 TaxID=1423776 RepID=A0A0R1LVN7_9LACO|nr:lipoate protein ligase C-terminal domain-containing protein [Secundilactobacillus odoratitofui]KRK99448.1 lipoate--protein ligase [Secundilactobacillus odoratitofui DSM 19909 = JCM 15043]
MIYFPLTSLDVSYNFAAEYYLMTQKHLQEPAFMVWATTPTIMLGKYQELENEVNTQFTSEHHIALVRRLSGGGTIYTDTGGCQFTLITPDNSGQIDFDDGLSLLSDALTTIGIHTKTDSRNDLIVDGLKVSGSAQYMTPGYRLHHGSLLFDANLDWLAKSLHADPIKLQAKRIQSVRQRTVNLKSQQPTWSTETFKTNLINQLVNSTHAKVQNFSVQESKIIQQLADNLFVNSAESQPKTQPYDHQQKVYVKGAGLIQVGYNLDNHDQIAAVQLNGDFFSNLEPQQFEKALVGTPHQKSAVTTVLQQQLQQAPIVGMTAESLAELLF